jgi:hypothetical protein
VSFRVDITVTCDACGASLHATEHRRTRIVNVLSAVYRAMRQDRWLQLDRGSRPRAEYCPQCADIAPDHRPSGTRLRSDAPAP